MCQSNLWAGLCGCNLLLWVPVTARIRRISDEDILWYIMVLLESQRITYERRLLMHLIHIRQAPQCLSHRVSIVSAACGRYRLRLTHSADYFLLRTKFGEQITLLSYFGPSDLHDITGTNTYKKRLKKSTVWSRLPQRHWLLYALLDIS